SRFLPCTVLITLALAFFAIQSAHAAALVSFGSTWKFLDDGSNQSNAWRSIDYEDDGWASGPAQLGYGDGDEATEVSYGTVATNKYITTYFRTTFNVPDISIFTNLVLNIIRDDGAVVYLNDVEVFRSNMPTGAINYLTRAPGGSSDNAAAGTNVSPARMVNGVNLLAVEIHQGNDDNYDISFDLEL